MNTKGKTTTAAPTITYKEVDFYREKFAEWLTVKAGKEARSAFFALWAIDIFSHVNVSVLDKELAHARRTLQKFFHCVYKPDDIEKL